MEGFTEIERGLDITKEKSDYWNDVTQTSKCYIIILTLVYGVVR